MSYQLVVSEKPSVGAAYAKVLGATNRQDGYWEGNGYLVSWCIGHLVELAPPNVYDAKYVKWSIADLPILPQKWQYLVSTSTKKQFGILQKLMNRPDVDSIVCATDAGREGELIFRLVYQQAGCKKPFSRLWLSSMEENAIREGFAHLKPSTEYDALYNAALCRERADWMVGINASRLFSCLYGQPLAVGRVMTPVLAMTVVREAAIAAFVPEKFYTVELELTSGCTASSRRIPEKSVAENLLEACRKEMVATIQHITRKEKSENPPPLYDLTTLQRDANRLLGYSAQQTLDYVQSLYEKKLTTYPRTDSCYITDDDEEMLEELTEELEGFLDITPEDVDEAVPRTRRTVSREKVTDHHAILPTRSMLQADLEALPKGEQNVLKLIIARTLMAVSKPFRYLETMLTTECAGEEFTAKGKEVLEEGWKAVERGENGHRDYYWGRYGTSQAWAQRDFDRRVDDYQQFYHAAVKHTELGPEGVYRYYSTQRPVDIGTYPKPPDNQPLSIVNYDDDRRRPVADGSLMAWGELTYAKPLTEKQMEDYELKPAPGNPDRVRPSITARLKDETRGQEPPKEPGQKRNHKNHEER